MQIYKRRTVLTKTKSGKNEEWIRDQQQKFFCVTLTGIFTIICPDKYFFKTNETIEEGGLILSHC